MDPSFRWDDGPAAAAGTIPRVLPIELDVAFCHPSIATASTAAAHATPRSTATCSTHTMNRTLPRADERTWQASAQGYTGFASSAVFDGMRNIRLVP